MHDKCQKAVDALGIAQRKQFFGLLAVLFVPAVQRRHVLVIALALHQQIGILLVQRFQIFFCF